VGVVLGGAVAQWTGSAMNTVALAGVLGVLIAVPATVAWAGIQRSTRPDSGYPATVTSGGAGTKT
jgi:hypothetical protein